MTRSEGVASPVVPEGSVDGFTAGALRGWVWLPGQPEVDAVVEVVCGDTEVATFVANEFRQDLLDAGKREGMCGFTIRFGDRSLIGRSVAVNVRVGDGGRALLGTATIGEPERGSTGLSLMPVVMVGEGIVGYLDVCGEGGIRGWAIRTDDSAESVRLDFFENGRHVMAADAHRWRKDLADMHQGSGSCGFEEPIPIAFCDGKEHEWDIRDGTTGRSLLQKPMRVMLRPAAPREKGASARSNAIPPLHREGGDATLDLTVVVNFYNMQREAARTLTSLSREYQRDIGSLAYEVLCIDNGSDPPLDEAWIRSFGPEFKLVRPDRINPSPCNAINEAAKHARGRHIAIMIDGAHVLTPRVFSEAFAALGSAPDAVIALRHWFVGGDQRWLSEAGYTREQEDILFNRIHWPADGYQLFHVSAPIGEHVNPWLLGMIESNFLVLPTEFYYEIGGLDEAFDEPGAGFANLDLFRRAGLAAAGGMISLLGEATFHQFHGGTTTNVSDDVKNGRVRTYANKYLRIRGEDFVGLEPDQIRQHGVIRDKGAMANRDHSLVPLKFGVTSRVRTGVPELHFDEGARVYLLSAYAESGLHRETTWRGTKVEMAPADLLSIQEIIFEQRPAHIVTTSRDTGLPDFLFSVLDSMGLHDTRITCVAAVEPGVASRSPRLQWVVGNASDEQVLGAITARIGDADSTLVLYEPDSGDTSYLAAQLQAYASLVSYRSYLIFLGSAFGQPWLGYSSNWFLSAIRKFIADSDYGFVIDESRTRQWITTCPHGYLRRVGPRTSSLAYDARLDILDEYMGNC